METRLYGKNRVTSRNFTWEQNSDVSRGPPVREMKLQEVSSTYHKVLYGPMKNCKHKGDFSN